MSDWTRVYTRLEARIESQGVRVLARRLGPGTTGIFDGLTITTNTDCDLETRCFNIAHSFGHIAQWSLDYPHFRQLYDNLYAAKANKHADPGALERALHRFREYEEEASRYAAWLLLDTGNAGVLPRFANFARADIEAIVAHHRDGHAPVWKTSFAEWNARVGRGELIPQPFEARPIPSFTPLPIEPQAVIQEVEGSPGEGPALTAWRQPSHAG
jgi:hypothetical protein